METHAFDSSCKRTRSSDRERKIKLGEQIFLSLAKPMIEKAKTEQSSLSGGYVNYQRVADTGYAVDAYSHVHKVADNKLKLDCGPDEDDYVRWAEEYEAAHTTKMEGV